MAARSPCPPPPSPLPAPSHPRPGRRSPLPPPPRPPAPSGRGGSGGARLRAPRPAQGQRAAPGARPPEDPRPPGCAPWEWVKGAERLAAVRRGSSAQHLPDANHPPPPPPARRPLPALSPLLSLFLSPPSGFPSSPEHFRREQASRRRRRGWDARKDAASPCGSADKRPRGRAPGVAPFFPSSLLYPPSQLGVGTNISWSFLHTFSLGT
uniref:Basic proline-rich protein-like n=1 Tax=Callorhinus ursinus TaxID=34884 RepID=A0A3Q7QHU2_CALUR|nr:basic proline-rich protein-like [Callorhinus ursinus]